MKKNGKVKKMSLNKETLVRLEALHLGPREVGGGTWEDTGPSCAIFRMCTYLDCQTEGC